MRYLGYLSSEVDDDLAILRRLKLVAKPISLPLLTRSMHESWRV